MPRQLTFDLFSEPTSAYSPAIAAALAALSAHGDSEVRGTVQAFWSNRSAEVRIQQYRGQEPAPTGENECPIN